MGSEELISRVREGISVEDALAAFVAACNRRDTLFITEAWFSPYARRLRERLSDPITADEAHVLRELLRERISFGSALDWLSRKPMPWTDYLAWRAQETERLANVQLEREFFPWKDVEAWRANMKSPQKETARPHPLEPSQCPRCQKPLTWIYFSSPPWTWQALCGTAGWLAVCDECHLQVDFKLTVMS